MKIIESVTHGIMRPFNDELGPRLYHQLVFFNARLTDPLFTAIEIDHDTHYWIVKYRFPLLRGELREPFLDATTHAGEKRELTGFPCPHEASLRFGRLRHLLGDHLEQPGNRLVPVPAKLKERTVIALGDEWTSTNPDYSFPAPFCPIFFQDERAHAIGLQSLYKPIDAGTEILYVGRPADTRR